MARFIFRYHARGRGYACACARACARGVKKARRIRRTLLAFLHGFLLVCFSCESSATLAAQGLSSVAHRAKEENRSDKKSRRAKQPDGKRKSPSSTKPKGLKWKVLEVAATMFAADAIRSRILTIRGVQVMLDRDLAELYGVPTKRLNEQVKRNARRFPDNFMFQLTKEELGDWRSQIATSNVGDGTGRSHLVTVNSENWRSQIATSNLEQYAKMGVRNRPYAFTEHGIIMLASVLKSDIAIDASIRITNAFIAMRKALSSIAPLMVRIAETERLQLEEKTARLTDQARNEERFKLILDAMQDKKFPPQKVFFDGQIYDAFEQMKKFVRMAKTELIIIDPYFADCVLPLIAQKRQGVPVLAVKNSRNRLLHAVDVAKFNAQYANSLTVKTSDKFHDRFLIIDKTTLIHVGASLNYLGKKCFAFSSLDKSNIPDILAKL